MNPVIEVLLAAVFLLAICWGIKQLLLQNNLLLRFARHPLTHSLALLATLGVIPFFVTVEMGGRYGMSAVLGMAAFGFIYFLAPVILVPIRFLTATHRFPSIVDIFVHRFRGVRFGMLATFSALLALIPFAMAQLLAIAFVIADYAGIESHSLATGLAIIPLALVTLWIVWHEDRNDKTRAIFLVTLAALALFALLCLTITSFSLVDHAFRNLATFNRWVQESGQNQIVQRYDKGYALMTLFFITSMVFPQLFSVNSKNRPAPETRYSSWLFPLLLFLSCLPIFPLLWAGLVAEQNIPLQLYATVLPGLLQMPVISVVAICGAMAAATCGFALLCVAMSDAMVSTFFQPYKKNFTQVNLYRWLRQRKRLASWGVLSATIVGALLTKSQSLTDMILVSFTGLAQLSPALLSTFYFSKINRKGVSAGLSVAMLFWFISLFLPLFIGRWQLVIPGLGSYQMGVDHWHHLLYEILFLNFAICLLVSFFTKTDEEEQRYADECMVDSVPLPQRVDIEECSLHDVEQRLGNVLGKRVAREEIAKISEDLQLTPDETRPQAIRIVREKLIANLSALIGDYAGQKIVDQTMPLLSGGKEPDDLLIFENLLSKSSGEFSGLSAELNRLRLHHRMTLENLPVGVCSLDTDGEVLFWNNAMEQYTGISADRTNGALLRKLPEPWSTLLSDFSASEDSNRRVVKVPNNDQDQWCNLYKTVIDFEPSQLLGSQVLLVEDVTESVILSTELIHTERLASVGRLAAGVAHEIGNPVTGIACLAQDLERDIEDHNVQEAAAMILEQTKRISSIVQSLTSFSRRSDRPDAAFKTLPIYEPIQSAVNLLKLRHRQNITFLSEVPEHIQVNGDMHQLTQIFLNLLANASDASPENGQVMVQVKQEDDYVIAKVIDQGHGIPEDIRDKVFEPFFTTKDTGEGTGLGLSLVYDIVRNHQGTIRVVGITGGNCMEVKLPIPLATVAENGKTISLSGD